MDLPELPRPAVVFADHSYPAYSAKQMRDYALASRSTVTPAAGVEERARELLAASDVEAFVREEMRDGWDEICSDTNCHPDDIEQLGRRRLGYRDRHWTSWVAQRVAIRVMEAIRSADAQGGVGREAVIRECLAAVRSELSDYTDHGVKDAFIRFPIVERAILALLSGGKR